MFYCSRFTKVKGCVVTGFVSGEIVDGAGTLTGTVSGTGTGFVTAAVEFNGEPSAD